MKMNNICVGGVFEPAIKAGEGASINFIGGTPFVVLTLDTPTSYEIEQCRYGKMQFRTALVDGVAFVFIKIGELDWAELPVTNTGQDFELNRNFEEGTGYPFVLILADENNGVVKAMRALGVSKMFSEKLNENIDKATIFVSQRDMIASIIAIQAKHTKEQIMLKANCSYTVCELE